MTKVDLSKPLVYTNGDRSYPVEKVRDKCELVFDVLFETGVATRVVDSDSLKNSVGWRLENAKEKKTFYRFDYRYVREGNVDSLTKEDAIRMKNYFEKKLGVIILSHIYEVTFEVPND